MSRKIFVFAMVCFFSMRVFGDEGISQLSISQLGNDQLSISDEGGESKEADGALDKGNESMSQLSISQLGNESISDEGVILNLGQEPETNESSESEKKQVEYIELPWDGLDRPEVEKFRQMYLSEKWAKLLAYYLESAMPYRIYVRKCLQERQMPDILEYLPVVESNYKTNAVSRSGAIGMWQFMANSVKPFLELNEYVDERLDPWKSTEAALRKLTDNYNFFQDWYIAIAAYNCGVGAMQKVLRKAEVKDFWYLVDNKLLPNQTALYVPKLLAIADLAINSEYYGLDLPKHDEEYELLENERNANFDYVTVNKAYSISQIAQEMRMDEKTLKSLNPSFVMGFTHPAKESKIRLPLGMEQSCLDALAKVEPIDFPFKYKVEAGDSLWSISRRYGVTVSAICDLNNIEENAILKIGKILYIPQK